jgi:hypothetical protein
MSAADRARRVGLEIEAGPGAIHGTLEHGDGTRRRFWGWLELMAALERATEQEDSMAWVQIQKAEQATWDDYERVSAAIGDERPAGLILHAAGEVHGTWQAVSVWESQEAYETFRDERLLPAVKAALSEELAAGGPPPTEWFAVKHMIGS